MSKKVCEAIKSANELFNVEKDGSNTNINYDKSLKAYCPIPNHLNNQECVHYEQVVASAFIALLTLFKNDDDDEEDVLEDDKLAEYAILWLCYKINQETHKFSNLNKFYNKYIKGIEKHFSEENGAKAYNSYKDLINNKICSNTIDISNMSKFYEACELLCKMYYECNGSSKDCTACLEKAKEFSEHFEKLNRNSDITEDDPYYKVLFTLSDDYVNLKNKCDNGQSSNFPSLPKITPKKRSVQNFAQSSEVTTSSSSVASKLIPALLVFAIPIFLGISYKYSLFGFDKRRHRQYLREKVKKIKKKMASYV
ncbi:CIR protein [Plasmodium chabaudi chabaudi]|uniref:CIR protein n=1 Tax=Plasmodium chabaudi chabaudi TaxID=31271 RepID=A0A077TRE0_PLACU|nr:CIR protein [Plasmodium chabaudi chabaudi]SCL86469.1 CIR protein [Plasmodium chabaudi chabaudi]VTZ69472.1 CIR protein [Plasmodium chabaudi chabaudi]|eukprot:XP_016654135.1 CIR protein [Plasmodium chabaudi chabaudi]